MLLSFNTCMDCAYLSVNRVNGKGENSIFSSQLRLDCIVRHSFHTCSCSVNRECDFGCFTSCFASDSISSCSLQIIVVLYGMKDICQFFSQYIQL